MDSGGGENNVPDQSRGYADKNALPESKGRVHQHRQNHSEERRKFMTGDHKKHLPISRSKFIIRKMPYFLAFASVWFVLYLSSKNIIEHYFFTEIIPLVRQSQDATESSHYSLPSDRLANSSAPTVDFSQEKTHPASNNSSLIDGWSTSSTKSGRSSLTSDDHLISSSNSLSNEFLRGKSSSLPDHSPLLHEKSDDNSTKSNRPYLTPALGNSSGPTHIILQRNLSIVSNTSSSTTHAQESLPSSINEENTEEAELERVLSKAAMKNKTVILTTVNAAWTEPNSLLDLFLQSFKVGNGTQKFLKHLVVIALDQKAYNRCLELHPYCYSLKTEGFDFSAHEAYFMRADYLRLVWRKLEMVHLVLMMGYNIIFTDADILWFRDPFPHFLGDADMHIACDHYKSPTNGASNTGFYYVKSNSRTVLFYKFWLASRRKSRLKTQDVFNRIRTNHFVVKAIGIKIRLLDTAYFGGFCEPSKDLNLVCTMHATCCLGLGDKLHDLGMLIRDWKKYIALPTDRRTKTPQTWNSGGLKCGKKMAKRGLI